MRARICRRRARWRDRAGRQTARQLAVLNYDLRASRLEQLAEGSIAIDCRHEALADGGRLHIRVRQSGAGFDPTAVVPEPTGARLLRGRGMQLVRSLAESLEYSDGGRAAEAVYRWRT